jgi:dynein heavy chain
MSEQMETLMDNISMNRVPPTWSKKAFPSQRGLGSWSTNIKQRLEQLILWKDDPAKIPKVTFINRLFNPQSFLTAIKQIFSREYKVELNKTSIVTEIQRKWYWEQDIPECKDGAWIFGFQVEGARWDVQNLTLDESLPKIQFSIVPVVGAKAFVVTGAREEKNVYQCPVYKTEDRMMTYVFTAQMKTAKYPPAKWILAGVALIMDIEGMSDQFSPGKEVQVL